jgi:hypothetical protein
LEGGRRVGVVVDAVKGAEEGGVSPGGSMDLEGGAKGKGCREGGAEPITMAPATNIQASGKAGPGTNQGLGEG